MNRFTVLGSEGFIGRSLVSFLSAKKYEVLTPKISECNSDLDWGHVIYCIGLTGNYREHPHKTIEAHVSLLSEFINRCKFESFIYLSSTRVYLHNSTTSVSETISVMPTEREELYNLSKLLGESLCINTNKCKVVRLSNVVGAGMSPHLFVGQLIREALTGKIKLRSHFKSVKDYISISDVVRLLSNISILGQKKIYNVASGYQKSHHEIYQMINCHLPCELIHDVNAPMVTFPCIDISSIKDEFDFTPSDIDEDIKELAQTFY
jgi:nucleoside-diphosphate-sugar epimerase